jgi:hypothetical protein
MNIVADLFSFIPIDLLEYSTHIDLHEVTEKPTQFDSGAVRSSKTATSEATGIHAEVATVFLDHDIGSDLRRTKETMPAPVNPHVLSDAVVVLEACVFPACREFSKG